MSARRSPETKWATGSNAAFLTARYDERTGTVVALAAIDNLGKGAAGQMIQCANLMLGLDEGAGPVQHGSLSMSVTAAEGFVAAGLACRDQARAAATSRCSRPTTASRCRPPPSSPQNKFRAPPVDACIERLRASAGMAAGVIVNSGNANAGTGAKGRADAEAMCDAAAAAVGCDSGDMLVCSTGLIGYRLPMRKILGAIPTLGETLSRDGGRDAAKGILTTDTRPKEAVVQCATASPSAGWPRAAACSRPTWRRCSPS